MRLPGHVDEVLVVSWGLTLFVSTLYGDVFGEWDGSVGKVTSRSTLSDLDGDGGVEHPNMAGRVCR